MIRTTSQKGGRKYIFAAGTKRRTNQKAYARAIYEDVVGSLKYGFRVKDKTEQAVESLLLALKAKDKYTLKHSIRVARYATIIAKKMGLPPKDLYKTYISGLLHDVGKIYIPDEILFKQSRLTDGEFDIIKMHPIQSEFICSPITALADILPIIRAHHERVDGRGYPDNLVGQEIPLISRIIAVADTLDATTSNRPYQKCMPIEKVRDILLAGAGKQWDKEVVQVAINCFADKGFESALLPIWSYNYATISFKHDLRRGTSFAC